MWKSLFAFGNRYASQSSWVDFALTKLCLFSMGLAAGANINPERRFPSMFEPIHGSAPDIAGKGVANPLATVWSASQMLEFLGHGDAAGWLVAAIEKVLSEGTTLTPDLGGAARTPEVGDAIAAAVRDRVNGGVAENMV